MKQKTYRISCYRTEIYMPVPEFTSTFDIQVTYYCWSSQNKTYSTVGEKQEMYTKFVRKSLGGASWKPYKEKGRLWTHTNIITNLRVPCKAGNFLTSWMTISFSRRILLHGVTSEGVMEILTQDRVHFHALNVEVRPTVPENWFSSHLRLSERQAFLYFNYILHITRLFHACNMAFPSL
jgi:hypothetical protein